MLPTSKLSYDQPRPIDLQKTEELKDVLTEYDVIETDEELNHKMEVIEKLNEKFRKWIIDLCVSRDMPQNKAELVGGKIYTVGSYKLQVNQKGSSVDALCVAPSHIDRSDFFKLFYEKLKTCPEVEELIAVVETFVPFLRMTFDGVKISLTFATLSLTEIPDDVDLKDDQILKNLDPRCVRSLNGLRLADDIIELVPNLETFRLALHVIKLWARQHGIYSYVLGYLGGVSWTMLVARTCQLNPNAVAATIVQKFFLVFSQWKWPQPVLLKQFTYPKLNFPVWDPRSNLVDKGHLMPIITPTYPQQNSTHSVSQSTRKILVHEFKAGFFLVDEIMLGRAKWQQFFEKPNFFAKYKHFILLIASSSTKEEHLEWKGLIEAKIKHLVKNLEQNPFIEQVHVNPENFELNPDYFKNLKDSPKEADRCEDRPNSLLIVGLEFKKVEATSLNLTPAIQNFTNTIMKHATGINMYKETMKIEAKYVRRKDLKDYIPIQVIKRDRPATSILVSVNGNTLNRMGSGENAVEKEVNAQKRKPDTHGDKSNPAKRQSIEIPTYDLE